DFSRDRALKPEVHRYSNFQAQEPSFLQQRSLDTTVEELRSLVLEAVHKRLISDVPLGAFLSGGVDYSPVVAMITKELGERIKTFSIGFEGTDETEHVFARQIATYLGTDHHEQLVKPNTVNLVTEIAAMLDEPNGDSSCLPTLLLCQYTRQFVTVAISGDGGDEMFGGYGRYRDTILEAASWLSRIQRSVRTRRWFTPADAYLSRRWLMFQPEEVRALLGGLSPVLQDQIADWRRMLNDPRQPLMHRMR